MVRVVVFGLSSVVIRVVIFGLFFRDVFFGFFFRDVIFGLLAGNLWPADNIGYVKCYRTLIWHSGQNPIFANSSGDNPGHGSSRPHGIIIFSPAAHALI